MSAKSQVRFEFDGVEESDAVIAQRKERKDRLNKLVNLLDHQEQILLQKKDDEETEENGEDNNKAGVEKSIRPTSAVSSPKTQSSKQSKNISPSSPLSTRKNISIPSSPKKSMDSPKLSSLSPSSKNSHFLPAIPIGKFSKDKESKTIEITDRSNKPSRSNSFKSDITSKTQETIRSDTRSERRRVVSTGHIDTIKRLHQTLKEMEKEKQEKIDFIIDHQDTAHDSVRASNLMNGFEAEKDLKKSRRHSHLSQKDELRLAQLLS